ncbi:hypothetical protein evm_013587 [Chilo suppressalis]|nr:hypothetical protein evm_013587 [Chilo suppressalis]
MKVESYDDCLKLQEDLDRLSEYYIRNRITVNTAKCVHIMFTRRKNPVLCNYKLNNEVVTQVNVVRDLGVTLDSKLTFANHFNDITTRAYKNLGFIFRVTKDFKDAACMKVLYYAYVQSTLEYCSTVWNPQYITHEHAIERIQMKFVKYLNFRVKNESNGYGESCSIYGLITLGDRRRMRDMMTLFDVCSGVLDCTELINRIVSLKAPTKRTRHTQLFHVPSVRTNYEANDMTEENLIIIVSVFGAAWLVLCVLVVVLFVQLSALRKRVSDMQTTGRIRVQKLRMDTDSNHAFHNPGITPDEELSKRGFSMYASDDVEAQVSKERERQTGGQLVDDLQREIDRRQRASTAPPFLLHSIEENKNKSRLYSQNNGRQSDTNPNFIY